MMSADERKIAQSFNIGMPNKLKLDFNEPDYPMTVQDQIALDNHRLSLGLISKAELMVEYNKDLTIEEASAKLQENQEEENPQPEIQPETQPEEVEDGNQSQ